MVHGQSGRNLPSAIFAYRLHRPLTNRFLRVNGKRPMLLHHAIRPEYLRSMIGLKTIVSRPQPIRSETKTDHALVTCIFQRLAPAKRIFF